ncbi:MAG: glycoside hydrolase family 172 protein [Armatimonadota bacterium]
MLQSMGNTSLRNLVYQRDCKTKRISSYDHSGGNEDSRFIDPWQEYTLAEIDGAGCIDHIWITISHPDYFYMRKLILRMYWDGATEPSVECPIGDFFGVGHAKCRHFVSMALSMVSHPTRVPINAAMNCYFPMPFSKKAVITLTNESDFPCRRLYYYVDYEEHKSVSDDVLRFHAWWNREEDTGGPGREEESKPHYNLDGKDNYLILDAVGKGHYVGCNVSIDNVEGGWPGEGDDMIFIDSDTWPPSLHGTGTEDYFCAAWGFPSGEYAGPYHGVSYLEDPDHYFGKLTVYRHHIEDPIVFNERIRVTFEHRHANVGKDDWSSVAYWYQTVPHKPFPKILPAEKRLPRMTYSEKVAYDIALEICKIITERKKNNLMNDEDMMMAWWRVGKAQRELAIGNIDKGISDLEEFLKSLLNK